MSLNNATERKRIVKKFILLSEKYHKLSLLFNELAQSLDIAGRELSPSGFKDYLKELNLDLEKIKALSQGMKEIELKDLQKEK